MCLIVVLTSPVARPLCIDYIERDIHYWLLHRESRDCSPDHSSMDRRWKCPEAKVNSVVMQRVVEQLEDVEDCRLDWKISIDHNYLPDYGNENGNELEEEDENGNANEDCHSIDYCSNDSMEERTMDRTGSPTNVSNSIRSFYFANRCYGNSSFDHYADDHCQDSTNRQERS